MYLNWDVERIHFVVILQNSRSWLLSFLIDRNIIKLKITNKISFCFVLATSFPFITTTCNLCLMETHLIGNKNILSYRIISFYSIMIQKLAAYQNISFFRLQNIFHNYTIAIISLRFQYLEWSHKMIEMRCLCIDILCMTFYAQLRFDYC